jgi:hypothetical protein
MKKRKRFTTNSKVDRSRSASEASTDILGKAWIRYILDPVSPKMRRLILLVIGFFCIVYAVWTSLPSSSKEWIIDCIFRGKVHHAEAPASKSPLPKTISKPSPKQHSVGQQQQTRPPELLLSELQAKGLIQQLYDAEAYLEAGATNSKEESLRLYNDVLKQLSPEATAQLDQYLYRLAKDEEYNGYIDDALSKYRSMFRKVLNYYENNKSGR